MSTDATNKDKGMESTSPFLLSKKRLHTVILVSLCLLSIYRSKIQVHVHRGSSEASPQQAGGSFIFETNNNKNLRTGYINNIDFPPRLLFGLHPDEVIQMFASCAMRKRCHILYWHIQKTGGTNLADRLYFMNGHNYESKYWCCHEDFIQSKFRPNPYRHCNQKMSVYEVRPHQYQEVIRTCQNLPSMMNDTFVGLVTLREPLQRTVSAIHQRCNVHAEKIGNTTREICQRCNYTADGPFYDKIVHTTNTIFEGIHDIIVNDTIQLPLLLLDNVDIDAFLKGIEQVAEQLLHRLGHLPRNETFHFRLGRSNSQGTHQKVCDFGMTSSMMKQHGPSLQIYRWVQQGVYDVQ
jgi:hypothetical protein